MSFVSLNKKLSGPIKIVLSFNGETFKAEASSKFPHANVCALGSYRNSPFVTGQDHWENGLKTEIFNYKYGGVWEQAGDYPFSGGNTYGRYVSDLIFFT